jgi:uncharacterized protein (DUF697 family)
MKLASLRRHAAVTAGQRASKVLHEVRERAGSDRPVLVCGRADPAERVRALLLAGGGDPGAVQAFVLRRLREADRDRLSRAAVVVYAGEVSATLDAETRSDLAVAGGFGARLAVLLEGIDHPGDLVIEAARAPGLLPSAVVAAKRGSMPEAALLRTIAERAEDTGPALAARLPALRPAMVERLIQTAARRNGATAPLVWLPDSQMAAMTVVELRMVLEIAVCYGEQPSADRLLEIASVLAAGFGMRQAARELLDSVPVAGWMVKSAVAYSGTQALGRAAVQYFERGAPADVGRLRARVGGE